MAHPYQPRALVGNRFSDAYFGELRRRAGQLNLACAHCGTDLSQKSRVSNGDMVWCDASCQELWTRSKALETARRDMVARGWPRDKIEKMRP